MVTFQLLLVGQDSSSLIAYANTALQKIPSPSCKDRTIIFSFFWNFSVAIESDDANAQSVGPTYQPSQRNEYEQNQTYLPYDAQSGFAGSACKRSHQRRYRQVRKRGWANATGRCEEFWQTR